VPARLINIKYITIRAEKVASPVTGLQINHLSQNRLMNESQHGFRHKKSCLTNLLEYLEYVVNQIDPGDPVDII